MKYTKQRYCRNCFYPLAYKAKFCAHCGQKDTDGRAPVGDLMQQLWFRVFKLESRYFLILWHLVVPGKVSVAYFQGKQKRYPPPIQFFFVVVFFFILALGSVFSPRNLPASAQVNGGVKVGYTPDSSQTKDRGETVEAAVRRLQAEERRYLLVQQLRGRYDSLPAELRTPLTRQAVDSLLNSALDADGIYADTFPLSAMGYNFRIAAADVFESTPEAIFQKYGLADWRARLVLRQQLKLLTDPTSMLNAYLGNLTWTIFALVALMSVALRLLYRRQRPYYVEHFVFLLHQHTANFLLLTLALIVHRFFPIGTAEWLLLFAWLAGSNYWALLVFYRQGWFKTLVKWCIFSFLYLLGFTVLFAVGAVVVFLIF